MIAPLAKLMDWSAIQAVALMMPANAFGRNPRLEEAIEFLKGPDFIPPDSQPAQVEFNGPLHFRFPTPQPCDFTENNVVHGRLYRCRQRWQERPVIILLPGWNDSASYKLRFPLIARRCNRAGFNVATLVAPYHFQRRPRQRAAFDSGDWLLLAERVAQGIAEIRALTGWLLGEGCPAVALWGFSMGAGDAGMAVWEDGEVTLRRVHYDVEETMGGYANRGVEPHILNSLRSRERLRLFPSKRFLSLSRTKSKRIRRNHWMRPNGWLAAMRNC
jgi:pimeloyl-ACP methyl ester carboxylesterase